MFFRFNNCTLMVEQAFQKINRCYFYSNLPRARVREKRQPPTTTTTPWHAPPPHRGGNPKSLASCVMNFFFARADHRPRRIGICETGLFMNDLLAAVHLKLISGTTSTCALLLRDYSPLV